MAHSAKDAAGSPDAGKAVTAALGGPSVVNRLTPLFSFYSSTAQNHFYTSVPQMASAALTSGGLLPQPAANNVSYGQIGLVVPGYASFP
ncbi:MAG: hypothetical protein WKH97_06995 [Casimicrobiaceae bacterium]